MTPRSSVRAPDPRPAHRLQLCAGGAHAEWAEQWPHTGGHTEPGETAWGGQTEWVHPYSCLACLVDCIWNMGKITKIITIVQLREGYYISNDDGSIFFIYWNNILNYEKN